MSLAKSRNTAVNAIRNTISASLFSTIRQNSLRILFNLAVTAFFTVTLWFSQFSFPASGPEVDTTKKAYQLPFSSGLALLRSLQGITSTLTTALVAQSLEITEWTCIKRKSGTRLVTVLSLSPSTSLCGLLTLALRGTSNLNARFWSISRFVPL
jgi:hypothetical protein